MVLHSIAYQESEATICPETWLHHALSQRHSSSLPLLRRALALVRQPGEANLSPIGVSCLQQGLFMADHLLSLMLDETAIAASLVYSAVCYGHLSLRCVRDQLGAEVAKLVQGVHDMAALGYPARKALKKQDQQENLRKMLLAMVADVRIVLIKLVEHLFVMRASRSMDESIARLYAEETRSLYAPLANRLGITPLKQQLEDIAMRYLEPIPYRVIADLLDERLAERELYVRKIVEAVCLAFSQAGLQTFEISGRVKHIYGIWQKMQQKALPFGEIYDLHALRVTVLTAEDCYHALGILQDLYWTIEEEFDDYIAHPKANGYRSLHVSLRGPAYKPIEFQIRTYDMHQESESGLAAHWQYKEGIPQKPDYQAKIAWLRQVLAWQKELVKRGDQLMPGLTAVLDDCVYVFTPQADILELPKGATPLDFAYHINTDIGHRCLGAKVNGVMTPLTQSLNTGEQVEILIAPKAYPSREWLRSKSGYLSTLQARSQVRYWFDRQKAVGRSPVVCPAFF